MMMINIKNKYHLGIYKIKITINLKKMIKKVLIKIPNFILIFK